MKLMEIVGGEQQAIAVVHKYTNEMVVTDQLSKAVALLMGNPRYVYDGIMYRTVFLPTETLQSLNPTALLHHIINYGGNSVSAWAKTKAGMKLAVYHEIDSGNVVHNGAVTISRRGRGLDINQLGSREEFFEREGEVLCTDYMGAKIVGYGAGGDICTYRPNQYAEFIQELVQLDG